MKLMIKDYEVKCLVLYRRNVEFCVTAVVHGTISLNKISLFISLSDCFLSVRKGSNAT